LLSKWLIHKSNSLYTYPVLFIPKGLDAKGKPLSQMAIDYRTLNKITVKD
ncbi:hypothetical protein K440DRAFT_548853, partial [Wilcoxina mikolae CBS 423.85]